MTHSVRRVASARTGLLPLLAALAFLAAPGSASAQATGSVTGTVTFPDGETVVGASVLLVGTTRGASADADGVYLIESVPAGTYTIRATFTGYEPGEAEVEVSVGERAVADIALGSSVSELDDVVVVAYGTLRRADVTGAIGQIDAADIAEIPVASVNEALNGRLAGVQVSNEGGRPGGGISVRVRGANSLSGDNNPLYVIDGVPVDGGNDGGGDFQSNPLAALNPQDIEDIVVLKDASATAIYGARGSNGVILVTTKRGRTAAGGLRVSLDTYVGVQQELGGYELARADRWAELYNISYDEAEAGGNPPPGGRYTDEQIAALGEGTDWRELVVGPAPIQNYQVALEGGDQALSFYLSGAYFDQDGILNNSGFNRGSFRGNLTGSRGRFSFGSSLTLSRSAYAGAFGNSAFSPFLGGYIDVFLTPRAFEPRQEDGSFTQTNPLTLGELRNPLELTELLQRDQTQLRLLGNAYGELELADGLALRVQLGADLVDDELSSYSPTTAVISNGLGDAGRSYSSRVSWINENTLSLNRTFAQDHRVSAVVGATAQRFDAEGFSANASGFNDDVLGSLGLSSGDQDRLQAGAFESTWTLLSGLGRVNYTFRDRYIATVTGRYDGSSRFGANNRWAFFPSAAVAWRVSEEPFFDGVEAVDELKVRTSYGLTGSTAIAPYQTLSLAQAVGDLTADGQNTTIVLFPSQLGNDDLKWETTAQLDGGIEAAFFDRRLRATVDYFRKDTRDLLLATDLPFTASGLDVNASVLRNVGDLRNQGLEFSLGFDPVRSQAFSWTVDANLTYLQSKVLDLGSDGAGAPIDSVRIGFPPGRGTALGGETVRLLVRDQPFGAFYVYQFGGIVQNQAQLDALPRDDGLEIGEPFYVDVNGDDVVDGNDRVLLGDATPDFVGGLRNSVAFAGIDVTAFVEVALGAQVFNATRFILEQPVFRTGVTAEYAENAWTGEGTSNRYPAPGSSTSSVRPSDLYVEDADYLRLKTLTVGYTVPARLTGRVGVDRVRLYVSGTNLLTFTGYSGIDPDVNSFGGDNFRTGFDYSSYPNARTFTTGLNVQF